MDAVKFLKEWRRMCTTYGNYHCDACGEKCIAPCPVAMDEMSDEYIKFTVETIKRWSAEHPQKTRLDDLREKFPKSYFAVKGTYPPFYPSVFGYCDNLHCDGCKFDGWNSCKCWDMPLEE